jgi:hypothetical protein
VGAVFSAAALISSCADAGKTAPVTLTLRVYWGNTNPDDIVSALEIERIVESCPYIAVQTLFGGDDVGFL